MGCPLSKPDPSDKSGVVPSTSSSSDYNPLHVNSSVNIGYCKDSSTGKMFHCVDSIDSYHSNNTNHCESIDKLYQSNKKSIDLSPQNLYGNEGRSKFDKNQEFIENPRLSYEPQRYNYQNFSQKINRSSIDNRSSDNRQSNLCYVTSNNRYYGVIDRFSRKVRSRHFDPRLLMKYDVKKLIGKGSFSRVMMAQHKMTGVGVAIKMISTKHGLGPLDNEMKILARLRHPNVVRLLDVHRTATRVYVIMELAVGGELYERVVKWGCFGERDSALALRMLLDGLAYLHRCGVTHRDLKPENLLYTTCDADSPLLITDFGLAHMNAYSTSPQDVGKNREVALQSGLMTEPCGTPEYIAPEVLARVPYTCKVDIWAVGVLAYILLSGTMPFDDDDRTVMYRHILRGRYYFHYEYWCHISDGAKDFVSTMLSVDPCQRPTAEGALMHPWLYTAIQCGLDQSIFKKPMQKTRSLGPNSKHRTRSNRSVKSIARSDAGHRINKKEVERLHRDPEVQEILHTNRRPLLIDYGVV